MLIPLRCPCGVTLNVDPHDPDAKVCCPACSTAVQVVRPQSPFGEHVPEVEVEVLDEPEDEEDGVYDYVPDHADLPEAPPGTPTVAQSFWATLGRIRLAAPASCVAYGRGNRWAVAGVRNDVQILDMKAGTRARRFRQHEARVSTVAFSPDGRLILSGDEAGDLMCWNLETLQVEHSLEAHDGVVLSLTFLPSGIYALTGGVDGGPRLRELTFGKECRLVDSAWDEDVTAVASSRDGRWILAGGSAGRLQLWEVQSGECIQDFPDVEQPLASVGFSPDGQAVTAVAQPASGRGLRHPAVWRWETLTGKSLPAFERPGKADASPACVTLDREGKRLLIAGRYPAALPNLSRTIHCLEVWSVTTGVCQCAFPDVAGEITSLAVAPDNTRILAALSDRQVQFFAMLP